MIPFFTRCLKKLAKPSADPITFYTTIPSGETQNAHIHETGIWRDGLRPGWIKYKRTGEEFLIDFPIIGINPNDLFFTENYQYLETEAMLYEKANR